MIKLLIVDDQEIFCEGLTALLSVEPDFEVVGSAGNGQEAIALAETLQPDVILMDVRMPVCDGVIATREIHQRYPWIHILVLTTFDDDEYIIQSLQAGALGYLLKRTPSEQVSAAIRAVHLGYSQLSPTVASKAFAQFRSVPIPIAGDYRERLSKREIEVLERVAEGKSNREIAQELHLTEGTVKNYVTTILSCLGVRDRVQIAIWAQHHLKIGN